MVRAPGPRARRIAGMRGKEGRCKGEDPLRRIGPWFLALALWLLLMGVFLASYRPFHPVGPDLLGDLGTFDGGVSLDPRGWKGDPPGETPADSWQHYGDVAWDPEGGLAGSGAVRLRVGPTGQRAALRWRLPRARRYRYLGISCWVRSEGVRKGKQEWAWPRVLLVPRDARGRGLWDHQRPSLIVEGDVPWTPMEGIYRVYPHDAWIEVYLQQAGAAGTLWVDEVHLHEMRLESGYAAWKAFFAAGWFLLVGGCFHVLGVFRGRWRWPLLLVVVAILLGVMLPGQVLNDEANRVVDTATRVAGEIRAAWRVGHPPAAGPGENPAPAGRRETPPLVDVRNMKKKGHFVFFLVLGVVARFAWVRRRRHGPLAPWPWFLGGLVLFTAATEVLQYVTWTRTPALYDWSIDLAGLAAGIALALFLERIGNPDRPCPAPSPGGGIPPRHRGDGRPGPA